MNAGENGTQSNLPSPSRSNIVQKPVRKPIQEVPLKLLTDLADKASPSAPSISSVANYFLKMKNAYPKRFLETKTKDSEMSEFHDSDTSKVVLPDGGSQRPPVNTFHYGVKCDGCGAHPIIGPRFKLKTLSDYDLCMICFTETGSESDYIKMDEPAIFQQSTPSQGVYKSHSRELDSCFIEDVNIVDGTNKIIAPSTPFTTTWRMRNNGTLVWPNKTKLVWIGGDIFSSELAVELEIPLSGLAVGQELDVSVNFIAPAIPGSYMSYWRMESPSGQKFGQVIWVYIQVCSSEWDPTYDLNFPPLSNNLTGPETRSVDPEPKI